MLFYPCGRDGVSGLVRLGEIGPPLFPIELFEYHFELDSELADSETQLGFVVNHLLDPKDVGQPINVDSGQPQLT
jgi:hypothetical protein